MPAKIHRAAQARLLEIWDYTERTWSETQADAYVRELVAAAHQASLDRTRWRSLKNRALPGIFFIRHRNHFIFFRELSSGAIGVISILHENMDLPSRLLDDAQERVDWSRHSLRSLRSFAAKAFALCHPCPSVLIRG